MKTANATHDSWHPHTHQERETVIFELEAILASSYFCNSKRYPGLLRHIVENALAGRTDLLKERTLGIEVFDRPADYDTNSDTVVRYTAGEVRKRLLLYYSELDQPSAIRISLPAGSYIPEFVRHISDHIETDAHVPSQAGTQSLTDDHAIANRESKYAALIPLPDGEMLQPVAVAESRSVTPRRRHLWWIASIAVTALILAVAAWWYNAHRNQNLVNSFWSPVVQGQRSLIVCAGGSVFASDRYSGVATADKDIEYPFVSWQSLSAMVQISTALSQNGVSTQLLSAPSTPLTDLKDHSIALLGAYNNQWTMHLQQPLRYYFQPGVDEAIVDRTNPRTQWKRDQSLPYSSADDYGVVARFRDPTIDGWVVILAGLGRNGTEAAAQVVTSPHYLEQLRHMIGSDLSSRNIEAVVKVNVIDGKSGAPTILTAYTW